MSSLVLGGASQINPRNSQDPQDSGGAERHAPFQVGYDEILMHAVGHFRCNTKFMLSKLKAYKISLLQHKQPYQAKEPAFDYILPPTPQNQVRMVIG